MEDLPELSYAASPAPGRSANRTKFLVAEPWDKLRGRVVDGKSEFDVSVPANAERLQRQAAMTLVQQWAPDCSTFSRALERPIPGAPEGKGPMPLRSKLHPRGLPWKTLLETFGPKKARVIQEKLELHNFMAVTAAKECIKAVKEGRYVCIENPGNSYL